jgi:hypothetical protein
VDGRRAFGSLLVDAEFAVSLGAFGLEAPSGLGVVSVADVVRVLGHVVVTAAPGA